MLGINNRNGGMGKFIIIVNTSLLSMFLLCSNSALQSNKKQVKIIFAHYCECDFDHSVLFDDIKEMGAEPCSSIYKFKTSGFYDSVINFLDGGLLNEDSMSHSRGYGTNLEMYIGATENDSLKYEIGIDYKGYIFYNNKTYFPSKELIQFLCSKTNYNYCLCKK